MTFGGGRQPSSRDSRVDHALVNGNSGLSCAGTCLEPLRPGRLRDARMRELQAAARQRAQLQAAGHGGVQEVPESRVLREAECCAGLLVCHLALTGSPLDDELDEHLASLAHRFLGTRFVRTAITLASTLHLRLRTPPGPGEHTCRTRTQAVCSTAGRQRDHPLGWPLRRCLPAECLPFSHPCPAMQPAPCPAYPSFHPAPPAGLLCFREGSLVGAVGLDRFGAPDCIQEEAVDKWLRQLRMLAAAPGGSGAAAAVAARAGGTALGQGDGGGSSEEEDEEGAEWQQPCEVCGRRYPHQHIRSVYAGGGRGSGSDAESD